MKIEILKIEILKINYNSYLDYIKHIRIMINPMD